MGTTMPFEAFISYAKPDETAARAACDALEAAGIRCWIAPRDIVPGLEWSAAIVRAIDRCAIMILVFSSHANQSQQVRREVERAADRGLAIVPLRIEDVLPADALAYFLGSVHWLDALAPSRDLAPRVQAARSLLETQPGGGADGAESLPSMRPRAQSDFRAAVPAGRRSRLRLQSLQGHPRSRWLATALKWSGIVPILGGSVMTVALALVLMVEPSIMTALLVLVSAGITAGMIYSAFWKGPLKREVTLGLHGEHDEIIETCITALNRMEATIDSVDGSQGRIEANTGLSGRSVGENLTIQIVETGRAQYSVRIRSENKNPSTLLDWGKNAANIRRLVDHLTG